VIPSRAAFLLLPSPLYPAIMKPRKTPLATREVAGQPVPDTDDRTSAAFLFFMGALFLAFIFFLLSPYVL
jgi:hypothetical protein